MMTQTKAKAIQEFLAAVPALLVDANIPELERARYQKTIDAWAPIMVDFLLTMQAENERQRDIYDRRVVREQASLRAFEGLIAARGMIGEDADARGELVRDALALGAQFEASWSLEMAALRAGENAAAVGGEPS